MPASSASPPYDRTFDPRTGEAVGVAPAIVRITAPNASAYTFTGTNSFLIGEDQIAVLDPGPNDDAHFGALMKAIAGRRVVAVIVTHTHRDHSGLARRLMAQTGAPLWSNGPHRLSRPLKSFEFNPFGRSGDFTLKPDKVLSDGEIVEIDAVRLRVVATPGHCANHLAFAVEGGDAVLMGDHVMGWNSTVVAAPDGDLRDYLASLDTVIALPQTRYLPGHGGEIADGRAFAHALKAHRLMRNGQLLEVVRRGPTTLSAAAREIYPQLAGRFAMAGKRTLLSHAEYLAARGEIELRRTLLGIRLRVGGQI